MVKDFFTLHTSVERFEQLDKDNIPRHVAIIMDGNGRWAQLKNQPRLFGHKAGAGAVRETILAALELGIGYLTVYSFSSENWNRPEDEVKGLMNLFVEVLAREVKNLNQMGVRVTVIGDREGLPEKTAKAFAECEKSTAHNDQLEFVVALNYGGRQDIVSAARACAREVAQGKISADDIDEALFAHQLSTVGLPDPDLVIRTSGEKRLSNFLLWESAYSEIFVTDTLWPDFNRDSLLEAVCDYQSRTRRFGGL